MILHVFIALSNCLLPLVVHAKLGLEKLWRYFTIYTSQYAAAAPLRPRGLPDQGPSDYSWCTPASCDAGVSALGPWGKPGKIKVVCSIYFERLKIPWNQRIVDKKETADIAIDICCFFIWSEWRDSNPWPLGPEPSTLPSALHPAFSSAFKLYYY